MPNFSNHTDKRNYPWTNFFFENILPYIPQTKPKVFTIFKKYSLLSDDADLVRKIGMGAARVFTLNVYPRVEVVDMGQYGFTPPIGNKIHLGKSFVTELEAALATLGKERLKSRMKVKHSYSPINFEINLLLLLEVTVLHEMVHFWRRTLNDQARVNLTTNPGLGFEEDVTQKFEKDAYGRFLTPNNLMLTKYMPITSTWSK